ncbi:hypothetical protein [Spirosoma luteum]|uniref:hypothetical protein n=1 Tax=Spirosoma luteum TaxID=431553 RepID=UPI0003823AB8|nr:hypothetical protein [Spirosoma luteum]
MRNLIERTFPETVQKTCLQTSVETEFFVFDTEAKQCAIQTDPYGLKHFTVENPTGRSIHFLAIDHCLFTDRDKTRCDCAVFDEKTFCFIEIKETETAARRSVHYQKAKDQLKATIQYFQERMTFTTKRIEAYACVGRTAVRPARQTTDLNEQVEFADMGAILYHGNVKRFA